RRSPPAAHRPPPAARHTTHDARRTTHDAVASGRFPASSPPVVSPFPRHHIAAVPLGAAASRMRRPDRFFAAPRIVPRPDPAWFAALARFSEIPPFPGFARPIGV
ncbi:hypothetical protein GD416_29295, partial [Burkholderia sp. BE24]|nr:hypothetical protein [Burkholderia sp. BE24]